MDAVYRIPDVVGGARRDAGRNHIDVGYWDAPPAGVNPGSRSAVMTALASMPVANSRSDPLASVWAAS
ncbi:MAG: hypothetical protein ACKVP5_20540 [Aestuariivirga sp.]